jgi:EF hand
VLQILCNFGCVQELETIFREFDVDGNRRVSFHEFLRGVQGEMSRQRADVVHKAFQKIDLDNRGIVSMEDVALCFNASEDPDVKSGKYNARAVRANAFLFPLRQALFHIVAAVVAGFTDVSGVVSGI